MTNGADELILHLVRSNNLITKGGKIVNYILSGGGSNATGEIVPIEQVTDIKSTLAKNKRVEITSPETTAKAIALFLNHNTKVLLPEAEEPSNMLPWIPTNPDLQIALILVCLNDNETPLLHIVDTKIGVPICTIQKI